MSGSLSEVLQLFAREWMLPIACVAAIGVVVVGWRADAQRRARLARLGDLPVLERLIPPSGAVLSSRVRAGVLGLTTLLIGLALAGPRWGKDTVQRRDSGVDIALVLDVSSSMLARDENGSRLDRMKSDVRRLLITMPAARVALLAVAGRSYILTPLTSDHDALQLFLEGLEPGMVSQGGTALAQGVTQATQLLGASESSGDRALVVMSDGETWDEAGALTTATQAARDARIAIVTVGYGTRAGATIPEPGGSTKRDANGVTVITRANPATLATLAEQGNGVFVDGASADRPGRIRDALKRLRQTERVYNAGAAPIQRYQRFLWPALLLLLLDSLLGDRQRIRARPRPSVPVTAALLVAMVLPIAPAQSQIGADVSDPMALFRERKFTQAATALRQQTARGDLSLRTMYNLGTALLEADSVASATELLNRVVTIAPDAELRYRALFNVGLAHLRRARRSSPTDAQAMYGAAVAAYKRALRTRMDDADAKWNLELALREQQQSSAGGGGGGGSGPSPQQPPPAPPPPSKAQQELEKQRAEAVLNSAARDEREVQTRRQRDGQRREAPVGRDW
jgi:Ca-activated chloride channel homolog